MLKKNRLKYYCAGVWNIHAPRGGGGLNVGTTKEVLSLIFKYILKIGGK